MKKIISMIAPALLFAGACTSPREATVSPPNVVLITLESLRPDHMGCYGYSLPTTPALDRFAASAIRYENAHATTSWTLASHASILTGRYPTSVAVTEPEHRLPPSVPTLAEWFKNAHGYETAAFVSGPFLRHGFGFDRGFDIYDDSLAAPGAIAGHDDITNPGMERKLAGYLSRRIDQPFFLFAYLWDIHYDYLPPPPFDTLFVDDDMEPFNIGRFEFNESIHAPMGRERLRYLISQYDGEIRATDEMLGRLLDLLESRDLLKNTIVVITADHAEAFFEHGVAGHKNDLHVESVRVPLLVKPVGKFAPGVDGGLFSLARLPELIVRLSGSDPLETPFAYGAGDPAYLELDLPLHAIIGGDMVAKKVERWRAVQTPEWKFVEYPGGDLLFHTVRDPGETTDVGDRFPAIRESLAVAVARWRQDCSTDSSRFGGGGGAILSDAERARLEALGYVR